MCPEFLSYFNIKTVLLILALIGLFLFLLKKKKGKTTSKLTLDPTGLWKYHTNSFFEKKSKFLLETQDTEEKTKDGGCCFNLECFKNLLKKNPIKIISNKLKSKTKDEGEDSKEATETKPALVLEFVGDIKAKQHKSFASLVDEAYVNKDKISEIVVVITSPGGMVAQYGHVYTQMERLREICPKLTVCIDVVAASGGYLMSLPASKIIAAPFAMVGSVGVVAFVPNARKLLEKFDIQPRTFTAGGYKRTVGLFDKATKEETKHFQDQLETIHKHFLTVVKKYRPNALFKEIETGAHWSAAESLEKKLGLIDELGSSEDYLIRLNQKTDLVYLSQKSSLLDQGIFSFARACSDSIEDKLFSSNLGL